MAALRLSPEGWLNDQQAGRELRMHLHVEHLGFASELEDETGASAGAPDVQGPPTGCDDADPTD